MRASPGPGSRPRFRIFGTTADLGFAAHGDSIDALFTACGEALLSVLSDRRTVQPWECRRIVLEADNREALLVAWMNELIFLLDAGGFVGRSCRVRLSGHRRLVGDVRGEPYRPGVHRLRNLVKGTTWHELAVRRIDGVWRARVILDV